MSETAIQARFTREWLKASPDFSRVFHLGYRLTSSEPFPRKNGFPAALIDAIAGYHYLVTVLGFHPRNICIAGESAGGHLALSLVRYLTLHDLPGLPVPGSLVLLCPCADLGGSCIGSQTWVKNAQADYTLTFYYGYITRAMLGSLPEEMAVSSPWFSPGSPYLPETSGLFKGFPPTLLIVAGTECGVDTQRTLRDRLRDDLGEKVEYVEFEDAIHAFMMFRWHAPEDAEARRIITRWTNEVHA